ncbi:PTS cellbiose transporter subunit IIC, partial [Lachnospiraceae bacterium]|nr:PTS cellbiose transporter subunit IIC [Lachnospiraceae bacterium]
MVCSAAISLCYWPAPKDAGFHFVQATTPLTRRRPSKG